jgi:hypothetical protein
LDIFAPRASSIASLHVFSLPCDRIWGTRAAILTFVEGEALNLWVERSTYVWSKAAGSMNHSIYSADRATHLKIVVVALVVGVLVAGLSILARLNAADGYLQTARVIKAGAPIAVTSSNTSMVR